MVSFRSSYCEDYYDTVYSFSKHCISLDLVNEEATVPGYYCVTKDSL